MRAMQAKWTFEMRSIQSREERVVVQLGAFKAPSLIRYVAAWPMCDAVLRCGLTLFGIGRVKMQSKHDAVHQVRMQFSLGMGFFGHYFGVGYVKKIVMLCMCGFRGGKLV